jgi:hypothetical protein
VTALLQSYDSFATPHGLFIKPGGRVVAYVRSTGLQDGDDLFAASGNLVSTINQGLARCKAGRGDIVVVLPGHTETHSSSGAIWSNLVAGAQIIGAFNSGGSSAPTVTLSHTGASLAASVADVTISGLKIVSTTAALTAAIAITAAGCTFERNFVSLTGALGANPGLAITGAANCTLYRNHIVCDSTDPVIEITGAGTTNMLIERNFIRQAQATSGGDCINVANTAGISGFITDNRMKSAVAGTPGTSIGLVIGAAASPTVFNGENYDLDDAVTAAVVSTGS